MTPDGRDEKVSRRGLHDGAACGHGIGGRACGRTDDDAVACEIRRLHVVTEYGKLHHARDRAFGDDRVIERGLVEEHLAACACDGDVDHAARLDGVVAHGKLAKQLQLPCLEFGNKAHRADVDAEDGNAVRRGDLGRVQDRAVSSEADEHIRIFDLALKILKMDRLRQLILPVDVKRQTHRRLHAAAV